jgi:hypothetical protein
MILKLFGLFNFGAVKGSPIVAVADVGEKEIEDAWRKTYVLEPTMLL